MTPRIEGARPINPKASSSLPARRSIASCFRRSEPLVAFPESLTQTHDDENTASQKHHYQNRHKIWGILVRHAKLLKVLNAL